MNQFFILFFFITLIGIAQEQEKVIPMSTSCPTVMEKNEKSIPGLKEGPPQEGEKNRDVYTVVQEMPEFPGGAGAMMKYIQNNLHYPEAEKKAGISGKCFVKFIVEPDGSISNVEVLKGIFNGPNCNKEAIHLIESMPKWISGKQNGKPARVYYNIPISFRLPPDNKKN